MKTLVLDFDGVIADSMPMQESAWLKALAEVTADETPGVRERLLRNFWAGAAGQRMFAGVALSNGQQTILRKRKDDIWNVWRGNVDNIPGAIDSLRKLSTLIPVYVSTTAPREYVEYLIRKFGIAGLLKDVITDKDVPNPKPAPDALRLIASRDSTRTENIMMVGDTVTDFEMSRAAGSQFFMLDVYHRTAQPNIEVTTFDSWPSLESAIIQWISK